jgi:hypothetical protein
MRKPARSATRSRRTTGTSLPTTIRRRRAGTFEVAPADNPSGDDVRAGVHELSVQGGDLVGVIQYGIGNERPGLEVAAPL